MDTLLTKFGEKIKGVIEGFDRIVFKGYLMPLCHATGMQIFLKRNGILNKNYNDWISAKSAIICNDAEAYTQSQCQSAIQYLWSHNIRKEAIAHERQIETGVKSGLIGTWSCVESCNTYRSTLNKGNGLLQIKHDQAKCKHLYFYYDHAEYGFMSIRLQTWAPYEIQIALNGREWLRRLLDKTGCKYILEGNKFFDIDDYAYAQQLLNNQLETRWIETLNGFLPSVFPSMGELIGNSFGYHWILWQSEWAKDYIFTDPDTLNTHMRQMLRHAFITGTSERVLRYFGHPVRLNGQPYVRMKPKVATRLNKWYDGARIKHWVDNNSLKFYNEQNVLRFEFTMNNPKRYSIYRTAEGDSGGEKKLRHMRKGIPDITPRAQISSARIKNFTEQMAALEDDSTVGDILDNVSRRLKTKGKSFRALDVTGKDLALLRAIADPKYFVDAITNKHLQSVLYASSWANGLSGHSLSARISRHLRLLREHGIIKKLPNQHKYLLTNKGRLLSAALNQFLGAKVSDLASLVA
jgi:hypothetical protein